ncbi:MAG: hydantoinase/oxoprolinase family protein [Firmicutes bacterium]|nr:hydantoinase/oxoprolinase family protein [Bacillota bacterium]
MLIGIDVGGTFTDGVLYHDHKILRSMKSPTESDNLQASVLAVLDELLKDTRGSDIARVVLSTTLVTNLLATGGGDKVALILIPGPGLNLRQLRFFNFAYIVEGATDFRGRITEPLNKSQIERAGEEIVAAGIDKVAIAGKFSPRNSSHERETKQILLSRHPHLQIITGFEVSGQLNFLRRTVTTYYTAVTKNTWASFATNVQAAIRARGIDAAIDILKADGGTMPLPVSLQYPCETIFSGPAASTMGAYALTLDEKTSVVIDIGGTTTDLALILEGEPLHSSRGALIGGLHSNVRSFATRALALGGDSAVRWQEGKLTIGPDRLGPAACFGGPVATPTDAINLLKQGKLGPLPPSQQALEKIARPAGLTVAELAQQTIDQAIAQLLASINDMFTAWEQEPAYKIWELIHRRPVTADRVIGIGAAAAAFMPLIAAKLGCRSFVHTYSPIANALGAAVSRPTLSLLLHADTKRRHYHLNIDGITGSCNSNWRLTDAKEEARNQLRKIAQQRGIGHYANQYEFFREEQFNMIRGWSTTGKLYDVGIQIAPGVIDGFKGVQP